MKNPHKTGQPIHKIFCASSDHLCGFMDGLVTLYYKSNMAADAILFLPRCMEYRCGTATRIQRRESCPSVCLSVRLSNAWILTKRKKRSVQIFIPYERS